MRLYVARNKLWQCDYHVYKGKKELCVINAWVRSTREGNVFSLSTGGEGGTPVSGSSSFPGGGGTPVLILEGEGEGGVP